MILAAAHLTGPEHFPVTPALGARKAAPIARGALPSDRILLVALQGYRPLCNEAQRRAVDSSARQREAELWAALSQPMSQRTPLGSTQRASRADTLALPPAPTQRLGKPIEGHQVLQAIEKQDIVALSLMRDRDLGLLLRPVGHTTPLVYAMRLGPKHASIAIVLVGFFSRCVNNMTDAMLMQPQAQSILRSVRSNLRVAIQFGIQNQCTNLLASYLQVIVMSEGQTWIEQCATSIGQTLVTSGARRALQVAADGVAQFVRHELSEETTNGALQDYIFNATTDLFLMGCLHAASQGERRVPTHYFARDERVLLAFKEAIELLERGEHTQVRPKHIQLCRQVEDILCDGRIDQTAKLLRLTRLQKSSTVSHNGATDV